MTLQNIQKIQQGKILTKEEAKQMQNAILSGSVEEGEIIKIFEALEKRQLTNEEFLGILESSREVMGRIEAQNDVLDIVGTGGDGLDTFNISTLSNLVCAAAGAKVTKHGNRSASGKCGSFDVLEAAAVNIDLSPEQAQRVFDRTGLVFLFAPKFHPSFRFVGPARKKYGKGTYFNFLGPLLNPASAKYQIIGVGDKSIIPLMGEALISSGGEKVWFVQSEEGMDEFSPVSQNLVVEYSQDNPQGKQFQVEAICEGEVEDLQGGDVATNLEIFEKVLNNQATEQQTDAVAINAAAGMVVIGLASDLKEGVAKAKELLKSGKVRQKFEEYKDLSNQV